MAFGTNDPMLFGASLTLHYQVARDLARLTDEEPIANARHRIRASAAPAADRDAMPAGVSSWLA